MSSTALTWAFASWVAKSSAYMLTSANVIIVSGRGRGFLYRKACPDAVFLAGQDRDITQSYSNFGLTSDGSHIHHENKGQIQILMTPTVDFPLALVPSPKPAYHYPAFKVVCCAASTCVRIAVGSLPAQRISTVRCLSCAPLA